MYKVIGKRGVLDKFDIMKKLILLFLITTSVSVISQQRLEFKVKGLGNNTVYLARYFGEKLYYADTAFSRNDRVVFNSKTYRDGVYAIVCPDSKYFEFIVTDEDVIIETDINDFSGKMNIIKSENNRVFYNYINYLDNKKKEAANISGSLKEQKMASLNNEVKSYQKKNIFGKSHLFGAKVLAMSIDPEIPEFYNSNDTLKYRFFLEHYWDNIDVTDNRVVYTPVFHNKLDYFFKKMIPQHPDSICKYAVSLIDYMPQGSDLFKYTVHYITYNYEASSIMGMDAVFNCMAQSYYCPAENSQAFWLEHDKLVDVCEKANKLESLLIGKIAPRLILYEPLKKRWVDIYKIKSKYVALVFWDPETEYCKELIPKLFTLNEKLLNRGVDIQFVSVGTDLENRNWLRFINKYNLNWINISDFPEANENAKQYIYEKRVTTFGSLNFRLTYDIFKTPQVYLLDKNKMIIGKKLNNIGLEEMINHLESKNEFALSPNTNSNNYAFSDNKKITQDESAFKNTNYVAEKNNNVNAENTLTKGQSVDNPPLTNKQSKNVYALIIGNEDYSTFQDGLESEADVKYAKNDAKVFKEYCINTLGVPERQIKLLLDATSGIMKQGLAWLNNLAEVTDGEATLIFYYAGHGLPEEGTNKPFLVPVDVSGSYIYLGVSLNEVISNLSEHPTNKSLVFLDACFSGGARKEGLVAMRGVKIKPKEENLLGNLVILSSSSSNESSGSYDDKNHGMFTYFLLKKLQESNGTANLKQLSDYVYSSVRKESALSGKIQTPQVQSSSSVGKDWESWTLFE